MTGPVDWLAPERRGAQPIVLEIGQWRNAGTRVTHQAGGEDCSAEKKQEWHQQYDPQHDRERDARKNTAR